MSSFLRQRRRKDHINHTFNIHNHQHSIIIENNDDYHLASNLSDLPATDDKTVGPTLTQTTSSSTDDNSNNDSHLNLNSPAGSFDRTISSTDTTSTINTSTVPTKAGSPYWFWYYQNSHRICSYMTILSIFLFSLSHCHLYLEGYTNELRQGVQIEPAKETYSERTNVTVQNVRDWDKIVQLDVPYLQSTSSLSLSRRHKNGIRFQVPKEALGDNYREEKQEEDEYHNEEVEEEEEKEYYSEEEEEHHSEEDKEEEGKDYHDEDSDDYIKYHDDIVKNYFAFDDDHVRHEECRRTSWHRNNQQNCNMFHEFDLIDLNNPIAYLASGSYRDAFLMISQLVPTSISLGDENNTDEEIILKFGSYERKYE